MNQTPSAGETPALASLRAEFREPAKKFRPIVRWWWPGNDVSEAELRREIAALDQAGFGGAEIQAFYKSLNPDELSDTQKKSINEYATAGFFRNVAVAATEAREHGLFIDYTFGSGWPFGGGNAITPELSSIELRSSHQSVQGPAMFHTRLQIPSIFDGDPAHTPGAISGLSTDWVDRMKRRTKIVAVVAVRGSDAEWAFYQSSPRGRNVLKSGELVAGTAIDLTAHLQPDGLLQWDVPPGTWQLFVFCSLPTGQRVNGAAGEGPQLVLDHLNAEAFRAHASRVGDAALPYLRDVLGNGMRAVFCDSLEVGANLYWSDDFLEEFRHRRTYDLLPYLPVLKVQTLAEPFDQFHDTPIFDMKGVGDQVRHDYRRTVSELMTERFYDEFNRWAHNHKLLSRTQAHGAPVDVLTVYGQSDIPETEQLYDMGCYDFLKLASSAAHVNGRAIVGSESFVWPWALYQTTIEKIKLAADELFTAGVNAIVYHGFAYRVPDVPAPGWHPFSGIKSGNYSSQFNEQNPLWPYFAQLNRYITRLQYLSQTGKIVAAIALYRDALTHGAEETPPTPPLNQAMMDAGYHYDHINEDSLLQSKVQNKILVTAGGTSYRAFVLPSIPFMSAQLARKIEAFASQGLPVFVSGELPLRANGFTPNDKDTRLVQQTVIRIRQSPNCHISADMPHLISQLARLVKPNISFRGKPLPFLQKMLGSSNMFFLRNSSGETRRLDAEFEAEGNPELWDAWTGDVQGIPHQKLAAKKTAIQLELQPLSSALIVFSPEQNVSPGVKQVFPGTLVRTEKLGTTGWNLAATGTTPAGEHTTIRRTLPLLVDWSLDEELRGFSGRGVYTTNFTVPAGFRESRIILDLGDVREVAEVKINRKPVGTVLLRPYEVDITDCIEPGANGLEITVTNTLFNSMALREPRPFAPGPTENASGLMSGGLIGPVLLKLFRGTKAP
ncbi:MAG TPA: glycosyl hydrolase [Acidobacteriaceae bacterium]|nr:glycosyl hydrolase [Acidobacteriaceae bacterium]